MNHLHICNWWVLHSSRAAGSLCPIELQFKPTINIHNKMHIAHVCATHTCDFSVCTSTLFVIDFRNCVCMECSTLQRICGKRDGRGFEGGGCWWVAEHHCVLIKILIPFDMAYWRKVGEWTQNVQIHRTIDYNSFNLVRIGNDIFHFTFCSTNEFDGLMRCDGNGRPLIGFVRTDFQPVIMQYVCKLHAYYTYTDSKIWQNCALSFANDCVHITWILANLTAHCINAVKILLSNTFEPVAFVAFATSNTL